jgi:hypothetical protein
MALDRSFGLHAICVRVGAGHKEHGHKNGVSFRIHGLYREDGVCHYDWITVSSEYVLADGGKDCLANNK